MISAFIPAYNEESVLASSVERVKKALDGLDYELFVVDDASTDSTPAIAAALAKADPRVRHLRFEGRPTRRENLAGAFREASGDVIAFVDADMSAPPEWLPKMAQMLADADIVVGSRYASGASARRHIHRHLFSRIASAFTRAYFGSALRDYQCGLKAFRRGAILGLVSDAGYDATLRRGFAWDTEILLRAQRKGLRISELPIAWSESQRSSVSVLRDWRMIPYVFGMKGRLG
jgi:glycosyltransferase AglD